MKYNYLLSICMMVKDEGKNIRRCLDAMKYLIDKDDVELIIVDTGSKDRTADIAREFTDKLYFHQWGNNFSEMRNITISYAKGEYILIMDADEVLTDPASLYEYIRDERLKEYNTYLFQIKTSILQETLPYTRRKEYLKMTGHSDMRVLYMNSRYIKHLYWAPTSI